MKIRKGTEENFSVPFLLEQFYFPGWEAPQGSTEDCYFFVKKAQNNAKSS